MLKLLILLVLFVTTTIVDCQNSDLSRSFYNSRYDQYDIDQETINLRRPIKRYQYEDEDVVEDEQDAVPQKMAPSHKDYEQILKQTHLARQRIGTKKPNLSQQNQQTAEQYLKEVNPTTSTVYNNNPNRPSYSRYNLKQDDRRNPTKYTPYRYVPQQEPQSRNYPEYQYQEETTKSIPVKPTPFNIVAYQNALLAQQKVLAEAANVEQPPTRSQTLSRPQKNKQKSTQIPKEPTQYEYYPQRRQQTEEQRYQLPIIESDEFAEKSSDYEQISTVKTKINKNPDSVRKLTKYQVDEQIDDYPVTQKYQIDDQFVDYAQHGEIVESPRQQQQRYQSQRRQILTKTQPKFKYETNDDQQNDYIQYQPVVANYKPETTKRKLPQQYRQINSRQNRYPQSHRHYVEETPNLPQFTDLSYQQSRDVPLIYRPSRVVYRAVRQDCDESKFINH